MLCCLKAWISSSTSSSPRNRRPSIRCTSIRRYGNVGEFRTLSASSTTSSSRSSSVTGEGSTGCFGDGSAGGGASVCGGRSADVERVLRRALRAFFFAPGRGAVIGGTPLAGTLPAMLLPAAKGTAQVQPTCAARMSKKADSAVAAASDTATQVGIRLHNGVQRGLILAHERVSAIVLVPVRTKGEKPLESYDKKAKLSPIMESVKFTPSCYFIAAKASRSSTRFFLRPAVEIRQLLLTNAPFPRRSPNRTPCQLRSSSPTLIPGNDYLERRRSLSLHPSR